jgi:hypothetical protein
MNSWFDDISRIIGNPMPRRRALKISSLAGASLASLIVGEARAHGNSDPCGACTSDEFCVCVQGGLCTCCKNGGGACCGLICICCDPGWGCISPDGVPECINLTRIELRSFTVDPCRDGTMALAWETATESAVAGFNIYRAKSRREPYTRITDAPIGSKAKNAAWGASYSFTDRLPGGRSFRYMLETVDMLYAGSDRYISGISTMYGPTRSTSTQNDKGPP